MIEVKTGGCDFVNQNLEEESVVFLRSWLLLLLFFFERPRFSAFKFASPLWFLLMGRESSSGATS